VKNRQGILRRGIWMLQNEIIKIWDFFFCIVGGGVQLSPLGTATTNRPIVPAPDCYDDGEIGGMIGRGNRSTRRKPTPVPLCPPQTPHAARTRTRTAVVGSQRLTAWATARPKHEKVSSSVSSARISGCNKICRYVTKSHGYYFFFNLKL
jgi:hypothetical protein